MNESFGLFIPLLFYAIIIFIVIVILIVLIVKRVQNKKDERFEKRDN